MADTPRKQTILVVDDAPENLDVLSGILKGEYRVKVANSGERCLQIALTSPPPDLILLDVMMPGLSGWEVCAQLKDEPRTNGIPVIFVTALSEVGDEAKGFELGAVDYITKPVSPPIVLARVATHLNLHNQELHLRGLVQQRTEQLASTRLAVINRLGKAAEFKDNETGLHVIRMSRYSRLIALKAGFSETEAELLLNAAPMHDVGKIGIPDHILRKPGKLDADEWEIMKTHAAMGAEIIGDDDSHLLSWARTIAETHHEKWDGSGYPNGLAGEEIPMIGRIVAIADVFDALTSERPYKAPWPMEKVLGLFTEERGKHFDPFVHDCFMAALPEIDDIRRRFSER
ncbi:MAG: two-component system response regulator [Halochromatium sp.]|nr:two-component system response regulator [Halochromatium sp.]